MSKINNLSLDNLFNNKPTDTTPTPTRTTTVNEQPKPRSVKTDENTQAVMCGDKLSATGIKVNLYIRRDILDMFNKYIAMTGQKRANVFNTALLEFLQNKIE